MGALREWLQRLSGMLFKTSRERDMEEELRSHLEFAAQDRLRRSGSPEDAEREARLQAGGLTQAMDAMRDQRGLPYLEDLSRDLRHAVRSLFRTPVFTVVTLITLALGIGANTAIFSVLHAVIMRPLNYPKAEQLVYVSMNAPQFPTARWLSEVSWRERTLTSGVMLLQVPLALMLGSDLMAVLPLPLALLFGAYFAYRRDSLDWVTSTLSITPRNREPV